MGQHARAMDWGLLAARIASPMDGGGASGVVSECLELCAKPSLTLYVFPRLVHWGLHFNCEVAVQ